MKLTNEEKIIALFMAVQYKYFKIDKMSENAQIFYSNLLYRLSKKNGLLKGEEIEILKGFLNFDREKLDDKLLVMVNVDDFPKTKIGQYYLDFLTDKKYALQKFAKEYLRDILTEKRVDNILDEIEIYKNEIIEKYNQGSK